MTLPLILLRDRLDSIGRAQMEDLFASGASTATLHDPPLGDAYAEALTETRSRVTQMLAEAADGLSALPAREAAERLASLTRWLGARDR